LIKLKKKTIHFYFFLFFEKNLILFLFFEKKNEIYFSLFGGDSVLLFVGESGRRL